MLTSFNGAWLEFSDDRLVRADCSGGDADKLRRILESYLGASYVGEWSSGCNPDVLHPMRDIHSHEKIAGSFHLTPGIAYDEADNGSRSKISLGPPPEPAPRLRRRHYLLRRRADPHRRPVDSFGSPWSEPGNQPLSRDLALITRHPLSSVSFSGTSAC